VRTGTGVVTISGVLRHIVVMPCVTQRRVFITIGVRRHTVDLVNTVEEECIHLMTGYVRSLL